jgi:hypothetical protein
MTSQLPTRKVGTTEVSAILLGYGAMGMSSFYGAAAPDEEQSNITSASASWRSDLVSHNACLLSDARCCLRGRLHQLGHRRRVRRFGIAHR